VVIIADSDGISESPREGVGEQYLADHPDSGASEPGSEAVAQALRLDVGVPSVESPIALADVGKSAVGILEFEQILELFLQPGLDLTRAIAVPVHIRQYIHDVDIDARGRGAVADEERLGAGRFLSADLGLYDGAELRLVGRSDDLVNVRGQKVHPAEVEAVVSTMAGVEEVVVVGVDADDASTQWLRAVVAVSSGRPRAEDIIRRCRSRLAPHKVPRSVVLVERIPRNARGKIDRAALARNG